MQPWCSSSAIASERFQRCHRCLRDGVAGIDEIGCGVVRGLYFMELEESHVGDRERKIVDYQIWSLPQLMENLAGM